MVAYLACWIEQEAPRILLRKERALEVGRKVGEHRSGGGEGLVREHPKGYQPPGKLARFANMALWVMFYTPVLIIKKMEGIE